jgi:hypothetical protein
MQRRPESGSTTEGSMICNEEGEERNMNTTIDETKETARTSVVRQRVLDARKHYQLCLQRETEVATWAWEGDGLHSELEDHVEMCAWDTATAREHYFECLREEFFWCHSLVAPDMAGYAARQREQLIPERMPRCSACGEMLMRTRGDEVAVCHNVGCDQFAEPPKAPEAAA